MPAFVNGAEQTPLPGVSMKYSFEAGANDPTRKVTQYYEMLGARGLWHNGWKVVTEHGPLSGPGINGGFQNDTWQLFHTDVDRSEAHDVAAQHPDIVEELKAMWYAEAGKYNVLPLNSYVMDDPAQLAEFFSRQYHVATPKTGRYTYYPGTSAVPEHSAANTHNRSFKVMAEVSLDDGQANGVIFAQGARFGGHSMFVKDGRLVYAYNFMGMEEQQVSAEMPHGGRHVLGVEFTREGMDADHQPIGTMKLHIDNQTVDHAQMRTMLIQYTLCGEGLCIGYDAGDAVSRDYQPRFDFTGGQIEEVVFDVADDTYQAVEGELAALMARD
jgi:arylsulfatase